MTELTLNSEKCKNLVVSGEREWLETNGLGGFSSSTVCGANTRRYHGLLVSCTVPPVERFVMLSKMDECIQFAGLPYNLSTNFFPDTVLPTGYSHIRSFSRDPFPTWVYELPGVLLKKTIGMLHGENTLVILYEVIHADAPFLLELRPFIAARSYHALAHRNDAFNQEVNFTGNTLTARPYDGLPPLKIHVPGGAFRSTPDWHLRFQYPVERSRGYDFEEDLFTPGTFELSLKKGSTVAVVVSTELTALKEGKKALSREASRREELGKHVPVNDDIATQLAFAADQFLVRRGKDGLSIIAGYPWFTDWGRDAMIALPGLCLTTKRYLEAKKILKTFIDNIDEGMIPNLFPDGNEPPLFNTVDATLWLFSALYKYWKLTDDHTFIKREAIPALKSVLDWHTRGTRFDIHEDSDGLLAAGSPSIQLTWMDAKVGSWVVTPRNGKPVEIQALWYNAHCVLAEFLEGCGGAAEAPKYLEKARKIREQFSAQFWNEEQLYYYDCINGKNKDDSLRPNQLMALSLDFPVATLRQAEPILRIVTEKLYTPYGMRTLSPDSPAYKGHYQGSHEERDAAYHQGTAWGWLLGPYVSALLRFGGPNGIKRARNVVETASAQLLEGCIGSISEISDGDPPHHCRGAFAQAWSVGELLRAYVEVQSEETPY